MNTSRVPSGVPTGGQFAASVRGEAQIEPLTASTLPEGGLDEYWPTDAEAELMVAVIEARETDETLEHTVARIETALRASGVDEADLPSTDRLMTMVSAAVGPDVPRDTPAVAAAPQSPIDAYTDARAKVDHDWNLLTENIEILPGFDERAERYIAVAEHFEATAIAAASATPVEDVPGPGQTVLNAHTGTVYAAADYTSRARLNAGYAPFRTEEIAFGGDALAARAFDTRDFTTADGIPMRARIIRRGESYGRSGGLVADRDMVAFFDARYPDHPPFIGSELAEARERNGQHITHYNLDTLTDNDGHGGLDLYAGEPDWKIDAATYRDVRAWMAKRSRSGA